MQKWILMGDVINSRSADQTSLQQNFGLLIKTVNDQFNQCFESPLTVTLGDEFQCIVKSAEAAAHVIFALEEKKWDLSEAIQLRYSLGFGEISTPINPVIAYGMLGPGLSFTREALLEMKNEEERFVLAGNIPNQIVLSLSMNLFLEKQEEWKWKDREIIKGYFQLGDYKKVATTMDKDVSLIWRRFKSLGFKSYEKRKELVNLLYATDI